ncbi:DcaP family trimeric outer membrane transporter [Halomonas sp. LES1]|uniref:DcaP family trimeric outer membrane transporter n=1 Tax=Halomonas sp. LES1 TaxID=3075513 RepID=UPI0028878072|nr:DcaP family trimeric outer membrane transporter [Halomonas sp. LES1]MDT0513211.1 DcaP family trimeric outer membrane transporter [Halomonas sp. LES1]
MTQHNKVKQASIFTASALALAVASASHAVDFEVGDTKASVYGYAKLDIIYDVDTDLGNSIGHKNIALDGDESQDGHFNMHAYQSRIGFQTSTPVSGSDLVTRIEGDFYGSGGGSFRLRHAYGSWDGILTGQTWTNFYGFVAGTPSIDFTGPPGVGNQARQPQLRYTAGNFSASIEDPDTLGGSEKTENNVVQTSDDAAKSELPDVIARYTDASGPFKYSASAVLRQLEYDAAEDAGATVSDDSAFGWGIALEAAMNVSEAVTLRAGVTHGDGIGGYMNVSPQTSPAYLADNGDLETLESTGGTIGASIKAGPGAINASYNVATVDLDDEGIDGTDTHETAYLNYIWSPAERIQYGIEAAWASRETKGGDDGDATRIQGMVMYSF